ncbi:bifunctional Diphthamide synthesis DHP1-DPH2 [Babesia duncani]|uniref:2-(3-amino-3-carboxypropyl)histidine synthase subunit 1 n=1 Tax=Babesia duncani TaxID=323732 RepID=A0AAD9PKS1_9APIC|nr:bifunctional Diphthamide synthesis DHP1-DPH2 [Babesia duncani]
MENVVDSGDHRGSNKVLVMSSDKKKEEKELLKGYIDEMIQKALPSNYNFEVEKCINKIKSIHAKKVAMQMPEGLLTWACEISDILKFACPFLDEVIIMADVTYGACCIDDLTAKCLDCDLIIHYGHSCLIPITTTTVECLYVFVEITFSAQHLANIIEKNFDFEDAMVLMGTIQYSNVLREVANILDNRKCFKYRIIIPQCTPLLPGEVLGCTSPIIKDDYILNCQNDSFPSDGCSNQTTPPRKIVFIADGRFHLESTLIQNPGILLYRFDPFMKTLTHELYDIDTLHSNRSIAIHEAKKADSVCLVLSTLGRQGNVNILKNINDALTSKHIRHYTLLLSEITPQKLDNLTAGAFIQIGCPRLSIDWGIVFKRPLLNPYEAHVAFMDHAYKKVYPMDYYSNSGGDWTNHSANCKNGCNLDPKDIIRKRLLERSKAKRIQYSN